MDRIDTRDDTELHPYWPIDSFIREDEDPKDVTYEERVARAYESKLFKEYALVREICPQLSRMY